MLIVSPVTEIQTLPLMSILSKINHLPPLPHATSYVKQPHGYDLTDVKTIHLFRPDMTSSKPVQHPSIKSRLISQTQVTARRLAACHFEKILRPTNDLVTTASIVPVAASFRLIALLRTAA